MAQSGSRIYWLLYQGGPEIVHAAVRGHFVVGGGLPLRPLRRDATQGMGRRGIPFPEARPLHGLILVLLRVARPGLGLACVCIPPHDLWLGRFVLILVPALAYWW